MIQRNFRICMSTNYLALGSIYEKVSTDISHVAFKQAKALDSERNRLMSFSGFADEDDKKNGGKRVWLTFKCCRWGSPKFYQLIMNDIPLLFCLPFAYLFGLLDNVNAAVGLAMTLLDLFAMLVYLNYDDELSIESDEIYSETLVRKEERAEALK